jgi:5'-nucleotidase
MIILIDQDGVLADFEGEFLDEWKIKYPDLNYIPLEERTTFKLSDQYPRELTHLVKGLVREKQFYRRLPLISGAKEAITEMRDKDHQIYICTSPLNPYQNCILEKYEWVEEHLGTDWTNRLIVTKDKTLVRGDLLIDDNPEIKGVMKPTWEQIVYDAPYNRNVKDKRRLTWDNWRDILKL